jgi:branched-chain amino acid transport system permease protein
MDVLLQLLLQGLGSGALYAVLGLSFGLIFNVTRVFHFAQGAIFSLGAYSVYVGVTAFHLPLVAAMVLAAVVVALAGVACELFLYRPLRHRGAPPLLWFLASFAVLIIGQNALLLAFGGVPVALSSGAASSVYVLGMRISELVLWKVAAGVVSTAGVAGLLYLTRLGKSLRAIVSNPEMARIAGIDLERAYMVAYALGSALTIPASTIALFDQGASPDVGDLPLLIATVAVFSGGVGAFMGGALGGLLLGLIGAIAVYCTNSSFQMTIALGALTIFLLLRPSGLLGIKMRRV